MKFPLINRTHYSLQEAFSKPENLITACKAGGFDTVGLCDIGSVSAAVDFLDACKAGKVKGIIGCDFNGVKIFALSLEGWKSLIQLVSIWNCDERLDRDLIARSPLVEFTGPFHDCRYINKSDEESYRILRCLSLKAKLADLEEKTDGMHFPSLEEIPDNPVYEALTKAEVYDIMAPPRLPHFDCGELSQIDFLRKMVEERANSFLPVEPEARQQYRDRIEYEMKVIEMADLAGYFLIVQDFVNKARADGQLCSIGRGSSAGSLVSYIIGINLVNPMPYGLLFSRFFNSARAYPKHLSFDEYKFIDEFRDYETKLLASKG